MQRKFTNSLPVIIKINSVCNKIGYPTRMIKYKSNSNIDFWQRSVITGTFIISGCCVKHHTIFRKHYVNFCYNTKHALSLWFIHFIPKCGAKSNDNTCQQKDKCRNFQRKYISLNCHSINEWMRKENGMHVRIWVDFKNILSERIETYKNT